MMKAVKKREVNTMKKQKEGRNVTTKKKERRRNE